MFYLLQETDVYVVLFNVLETPKDTMKHVLCAWMLVAAFLHVKCNIIFNWNVLFYARKRDSYDVDQQPIHILAVLAQCGSNGELCPGGEETS